MTYTAPKGAVYINNFQITSLNVNLIQGKVVLQSYKSLNLNF